MATTTFSTLSNDAPNVWIARETYRLVERNLRLGRFAKRYSLPQRMSKTLRIIRHDRLVLPAGNAQLTEGTPPTSLALAISNVDVTVEQWGIVVLLTDVSMITTKHPALNVAINRTGLAMAEVLEREIANMLLAGTTVIFPGSVTARSGLTSSDKLTTATVIEATTTLRTKGAGEFEGGLFGGVIAPAQEGDVLASDVSFKDASNFANVKALQFGEIGVWMGVRWTRGNFLPVFRGEPEPGTKTATTAGFSNGGGGSARKVIVVARDINSDYERRISAIVTATNDEPVITTPTSTNYVYDLYASSDGGSDVDKLIAARVLANVATTIDGAAYTAGTTATAPTKPAADGTDGVEAFVAWIFGSESYGRVELNGMSLQSYITPAGSSFTDPLAQGRKVGSKIMWKSFIIDDDFFVRIETASAFGAQLPA